ncbi:tRNA (N(6)-L-threonylcarbamoyladenosine(37)-C(2))-methylthiotransferase MtaB [Clostridium sp. D2Q-14]|uniref:tRNA (N(6)-L-threonylcarbamoyladenosine(37)-C(2))- methylthiotransferase MtaB n=1 Tax=Anaeromonas gelatinilytica TaxID=2683194 RepID=UPI00193B6BE7|nr:tRNA (N(6)-L-threonylcarbamoyladenosine(37)-C(2))-methylthiotransferase MtaB [Anaeromonas gelatinilytica]MBS4535568.1 tRNA (N(6)-L-threonylcarbamoyladenosine(37)-C(2))-methylthiotransferase MtaB [Anaeromonas gelatinilytica]
METVAFYTLGCKVNQYETDAMAEIFRDRGYEVIESNEKADIYVINTCSVTNLGERKSRQFIRRSKKINSEAIICVVGCYAQISPDEVINIEGVDLILGTKDKNKIVDLCEEAEKENKKINAVENVMEITRFEEISSNSIQENTRAYIKIQEGCNQYCSYCIIPYARGPIRSRELENIIKEANILVDKGFKEIVLTGIHVASYGKDLGEERLIDVIEKVHKIDKLRRIRLSSLEPTLVTEEFMSRLSKLNKVCPHFHLSLQSGSDTVLIRMNRKYTTDDYRKRVELIRKYMKDAAITTDIIVGFPGESEVEFNETYDFVKQIKFANVHIFKYSPRSGTPAAKHKNQIHGTIKNERSKKLIDLVEKEANIFKENFLNTAREILVEGESKKEGFVEGYTDNYIRILVKGTEELENQIIKVRLKELIGENILGEVIYK